MYVDGNELLHEESQSALPKHGRVRKKAEQLRNGVSVQIGLFRDEREVFLVACQAHLTAQRRNAENGLDRCVDELEQLGSQLLI